MMIVSAALGFWIGIVPMQQQTPRQAFYEAWFQLEVEGDHRGTAETFQRLGTNEQLPQRLRARARIAHARCLAAGGEKEAAVAELERVVSDFDDLADVVELARSRPAALRPEPTRFMTGLVALEAGQFLDLDTGGLFSSASTVHGIQAEIEARPATRSSRRAEYEVHLPAETQSDYDVASMAPWLADVPWQSLTTDAGRSAWIQLLPEASGGTTVHFVTRVSGSGPLRPAVMETCCIGRDGAIEIHFRPEPEYVRYRVERREWASAPFEVVGTVDRPPFVDRQVYDQVRFRYRVTGETEDGDEGIPVEVQGTTTSRGMKHLTFDLPPTNDRHLDLFEGRWKKAGGDVVFSGFYPAEQAVSLRDPLGRAIQVVEGGPGSIRSPWDGHVTDQNEIRPNQCFAVRLLEGGVAVVRVLPAESDANRVAGLEVYVSTDGYALPRAPRLRVTPTDLGVEVVAQFSSGWSVDRVAVHAVGEEEAQRILSMSPVGDGRAFTRGIDEAAREGDRLVYRAVARDDLGRESPPGEAVADLGPTGPRMGRFRFDYTDAYSFVSEDLTTWDLADVVFARCAGGLVEIDLQAAGGIVSLESLVPRELKKISVEELFEGLVAVDPEKLSLLQEAEADERTPASDVLILRTRNGDWVKLAIVERDEEAPGGWPDLDAHVRFVRNRDEPVFAEPREDDVWIGGLRVRPSLAKQR